MQKWLATTLEDNKQGEKKEEPADQVYFFPV